MRILLCLLLLLSMNEAHADFSATCSPRPFKLRTHLGEQQFYDKSCALVVTATSYDQYKAGWTDLPNEAEADNLGKALQSVGFDVLRVRHARSANFLNHFKDFCSKYGGEHTRLLIYFSGHGHTLQDQSLVGYILPEDIVSSHGDLNKFKEQAISTSQVLKLSNTCEAKHLMFVFDSCFSAALFQSKSEALTAEALLSLTFTDELGRRTRQFITSSDKVTTSPANSKLTATFIKGLRDKDPMTLGGLITGKSMGLYVAHEIGKERETSAIPQYGDVDSQKGGDFIFSAGGRGGGSYLTDMIKRASGQYASVFKGIDLVYYLKQADGDKLMLTLKAQKIPFTATKNNRNPETFPTNTIACHADGDIKAVKALASILINNRVELMEIVRFSNGKAKPSNRIELLNSARFSYGKAKPLTLEQIEQLDSCPTMLANPLEK